MRFGVEFVSCFDMTKLLSLLILLNDLSGSYSGYNLIMSYIRNIKSDLNSMQIYRLFKVFHCIDILKSMF